METGGTTPYRPTHRGSAPHRTLGLGVGTQPR